MIEPTIGRVVWYHPSGAKGDPAPVFPDQPYVALTAGILSGGAKVNLAIFDHFGRQFAREGVYLRQDKETVEPGDAEWTAYDKAQAAKADAPLSSSFVEGLLNSVHERISKIEGHVSEVHETVRAMSTPAEPPPAGAQGGLLNPDEEWRRALDDDPPPFSGENDHHHEGIAVGEPTHGGPPAT